MIKDIDWYLDFIKHELEQINDKGFVGCVDFKVNIREGVIGNMNITLGKSVKRIIEK